ncbi:PREDICTED: solute carrier family 35 member F2 [Pseudopodoces humilis]|uniref:solute carrier family 35 member F2 n=1 Tax=Pseudopodoces humilis TaxID=181119 RepID=UPI0003958F64|nr:PREDICTED: solute carrier family 35 member F2 [Pseudopodoces humilis]
MEEEAAAAPGAPPPAAAAAAAEAEPSPGPAAAPRRLLSLLGAKLCTWYIWKTIILGQVLSMFICGTAVTSQYLAEKYQVNTPMLQSFINYSLLLLVYTTMLAFRTGSDSLWQILKQKWWKYIFLGLADVEANYVMVKAYQYTTLTSVQLLDCFGIPVLMALSWFILRARYRLIHFLAVAICLLGVGTMVGADILSGREDGEGSDVVIGDVLVLLGASLYAISNVCEEYIVKNLSRVEFLGMVGLFGTIISGLQLAIVEHRELMRIQWNWKVALLFTAFALCMFGLYSFMPVVIKVTSATSVNLGILTSDLYSLFFGLFLFLYKFSALYIVSFVVIIVGFIMYCSTPTRTAEPAALPQPSSTGLDNAALKLEESDSETPAVTVQFTRGETVVVSTD